MEAERERSAPVPTGDPRVDAAVEPLASLEDLDLADRPAVLQDVHDRLRDILGELGDPRPGEPGQRGEQHQLSPGSLSPDTAPPSTASPSTAPPSTASPSTAPRR